MSIAIKSDQVRQVLFPGAGWIEVAKDSFYLDAYEYMEEGRLTLGGGGEKLIPATGFAFRGVDGQRYAGPLTSVLAVRY